MPPASTRPVAHAGPSIGYNLALIVAILAMLGLLAAYAVTELVRRQTASTVETDIVVTQNIGGAILQVPLDWLRGPAAPQGGFVEEVALALPYANGSAVDVTLSPRSRTRPSSALLDRVYLHMFEDGQLDGVAGLIGKPLAPVEGYAGEVVWYDPLAAEPFVAKCAAGIGGEPARCLRTVVVGGLGVTYAFDAVLLEDWRQFDANMADWLRQIGLR